MPSRTRRPHAFLAALLVCHRVRESSADLVFAVPGLNSQPVRGYHECLRLLVLASHA